MTRVALALQRQLRAEGMVLRVVRDDDFFKLPNVAADDCGQEVASGPIHAWFSCAEIILQRFFILLEPRLFSCGLS